MNYDIVLNNDNTNNKSTRLRGFRGSAYRPRRRDTAKHLFTRSLNALFQTCQSTLRTFCSGSFDHFLTQSLKSIGAAFL